jgi:hypothetical protein
VYYSVIRGRITIKKLLISFSLVFMMSQSALANWTLPGKAVYVHPFPGEFKFMIEGQTISCSQTANQLSVSWDLSIAKQLYALVLSACQAGDLIAASWTRDASGFAVTGDIDMRKAL